MAKMLSVAMGREGHYRYFRYAPNVSAFHEAVCECGAEWHHQTDRERWGSFTQWADAHQAPPLLPALHTEQCKGSGGLIHTDLTDGRLGRFAGWCKVCQRFRPTSDQPGYDGRWRQFDPHPVYVAVTA